MWHTSQWRAHRYNTCKDNSNFLNEPSSRLLSPRVKWWLRKVFLLLLSLNPKSSQTGCECEPRGRRLHSALKTKDNSNRNRLANGIWCVEESITCSVILLPFNSCEEPKVFYFTQLYIQKETTKKFSTQLWKNLQYAAQNSHLFILQRTSQSPPCGYY